jgi:predicted nucleic acid-binding protein
MAYLVDTNIIFAILKGDSDLKAFIEDNDCGVDSTIYVECIQGSKSNRDKQIISNYLLRFRLYYHTPDISQRTIDLIDRYSNSHGLLLPDAQISAVALNRNLELLTLNASDFKFIKGLKLSKPKV